MMRTVPQPDGNNKSPVAIKHTASSFLLDKIALVCFKK